MFLKRPLVNFGKQSLIKLVIQIKSNFIKVSFKANQHLLSLAPFKLKKNKDLITYLATKISKSLFRFSEQFFLTID